MKAALCIFSFVLFTRCGQVSEKNTSKYIAPGTNSELLNTNVEVSTDSTNVGYISPLAGMNTRRAAHTATLLKDGTVLICGGFSGSNTLSGAERYEPATKTFKSLGKMIVARASHTANLLPDGKVLIAGGYNGNYLSGTEIFDPETGSFSPGPTMNSPRSGHTATLLNNENILFAGGVGTGWSFLESAEIYSNQIKAFANTGSMSTARESHTAPLLRNGTVLITGGHKGRRENIEIYESAEIYNPKSGKFTITASMKKIRHKHDAVMLADGSVLITGGADERDSNGAYTSAEIFNADSSSFRLINNMNLTRYKHNETSILLPGDKVIVAGGTSMAEMYDYRTGQFTIVPGSLGSKRLFSTATLLPNGAILITGGYNENMETTAKAWIYAFSK